MAGNCVKHRCFCNVHVHVYSGMFIIRVEGKLTIYNVHVYAVWGEVLVDCLALEQLQVYYWYRMKC